MPIIRPLNQAEADKRLKNSFIAQDFGELGGEVEDYPIPDRKALLRSSATSAWIERSMGAPVNPYRPGWQGIKDGVARGYFKDGAAKDLTDEDLFNRIAADYQAKDDAADMAANMALQGRSSFEALKEFNVKREGSPVSRIWDNYTKDLVQRHSILSQKLAPYRGIVDSAASKLGKTMKDNLPASQDFQDVATQLLQVPEQDRHLVISAIGATGGATAEERASYLSKLAGAMGRMTETLGASVATDVENASLAETVISLQEAGQMDFARKMEKNIQGRQEINFLAQQIRQVADSEISPIKGDNWWSQTGIDVARMAPQVAVTVANPMLGTAANLSYFRNTVAAEAKSEDPSLTYQQADAIGALTAPFNAAVETFTTLIPFGKVKLPFVQKWLSTTTTSVKGAARNLVIRGAFGVPSEMGEEMLQAIAPLWTQELMGELSKDMPAVDWEKRMPDFSQIAAQTWGPALVFSIVGGGGASISEIKSGRALASDRDTMVATGMAPAMADQIATAAESGDWSKADSLFRQEFVSTTKATDEEKTAAVARIIETQKAQDSFRSSSERGADELERAQTIEKAMAELARTRMFRDAEGWAVQDVDDGGIVRVDSREEAETLAFSRLDDNAREEALAMAKVLEAYSSGADILELDLGKTMDLSETGNSEAAMKEAAITEGMLNGMTREQAEKVTWTVLGSNRLETVEGVRRVVSKLFRGAGVMDAIEEPIEGKFQAGLEQGVFTSDEAMSFVKIAAEAMKAPELVTTAESSARGLIEAVSDIVMADTFGQRKDGRKGVAGAVTAGLKARLRRQVDLTSGESKFAAFLAAFRRFFKQVFQRSRSLLKARKEGTLSGDFDEFLDTLMRVDPQRRHEVAAAKEAMEIAQEGNMPFSIAPSRLQAKAPKGITATKTEALPTWLIPKQADSLPKILDNPKVRQELYKRLDDALDWLRQNPAQIATPAGWVKYLRKAGVWGDIPMPPSGLVEVFTNPSGYLEKLKGGYHGELSLPDTQTSAKQGMDGTVEMRKLIGEGKAPAPFVVALHHLWGILSRMLSPIDQEGMWLRLIAHRPVLDAIQSSVDGNFKLDLAAWEQLIQDARESTKDGAGPVGNAATANANSFYLMLERLNGRWGDMAEVYASKNSREMGRKFWDIGAGKLGIKNKVQRFIGLTFGIPGVIMDRWKFVEFWLPTAMQGMGHTNPSDYFKYSANTPSDDLGIYGVYGGVDSGNETLSLAMYEAFEVLLEEAIAKSPELGQHLGEHANAGGMHWYGWNAIKNEAVGHSSLDLTKELIETFGLDVDAEKVYTTVNNGTYFTEGSPSQGVTIKFILDKGAVRVESTGVASGLQRGSGGRRRAGGTGSGDAAGAAGASGANGQGVAFSLTPKDTEYLAAVEAGDMAKAQDMVDEAAKKAGYDSETLFRGRQDAGNIVAFGKDGAHFTPDREYAEGYAEGESGNVVSGRAKINKPLHIDSALVESVSFDDFRNHLANQGLPLSTPATLFAWSQNPKYNQTKTIGEAIDAIESDSTWADFQEDPSSSFTDNLGGAIWPLGFDAIRTLEHGDRDLPVVILRDPSQIKSADPVTRDESGQVIPLSQRFNEASPDIRFSLTPQDAEPLSGAEKKRMVELQQKITDATAQEFTLKSKNVFRGKTRVYVGKSASDAKNWIQANRAEDTPEIAAAREELRVLNARAFAYSSSRAKPTRDVESAAIEEVSGDASDEVFDEQRRTLDRSQAYDLLLEMKGKTIPLTAGRYSAASLGSFDASAKSDSLYLRFYLTPTPEYFKEVQQWTEDELWEAGMPRDLGDIEAGYTPEDATISFTVRISDHPTPASSRTETDYDVMVDDGGAWSRDNNWYKGNGEFRSFTSAVQNLFLLPGIQKQIGVIDSKHSFSLAPRSLPEVADTVLAAQMKRPAFFEAFVTLARRKMDKLRKDGDWRVDKRGIASKRIGFDSRMAGIRTPANIEAERKFRLRSRQRELIDAGMLALAPETLAAYDAGVASLEDVPMVKDMLGKVGKIMSKSAAQKSGKLKTDGKGSAGDYDGAPRLPPAWYAKSGGSMPYEIADQLSDMGHLKDGYADTLWEALRSAIYSTRTANEAFQKARDAVRKVEADALAQARKETDTWAKDETAKIPTEKDRQMMALRTLDAILSAFPPEIRAMVGGFVKLASFSTDAAREAEITRRLEKLGEVIESEAKKHYTAKVEKLFKRFAPKKEAGKKATGQLDPDAQELVDAARAAMGYDDTRTRAELAAIDSMLAEDGLTTEREVHLERQRELVQLFGDFDNAESTRMESAADALEDTATEGWAKWKLKKIMERERRTAARESLIADTGKPSIGKERDKQNKWAKTKFGKAFSALLNVSSFSELLRFEFGEKSETARSLEDQERKAAYAYEDAMQAFGDRVGDFFATLAGGRLAGEQLRFDLAQPTLTVGTGDNERTISQLQGIQALLMWQQEDGRRHMEGAFDENAKPSGKWHYGEEWVKDLESKLSPEAYQVKSFLEGLYGEEYQPLNAVYRQRHGVNLPKNDRYSPITVQPMQAKAGEMVDPVSGFAVTGSILTPGGLRTRNKRAVAEPRFDDAVQIFLGHSRQMEHWKAYYDFATDAQAILLNREVTNAVEAKGSTQAVTVLKKWVDQFAQGGSRDAQSGLEISSVYSRASGRAARVALLGRISTILIQSTQLAAASVKMPVGSYLKRLGMLLSGNLDYSDAIKSPFMQRRYKTAPPIVQQALAGVGDANRPGALSSTTPRILGNALSGADALFTGGTYAMLLDYHRSVTGPAMGLQGAELEQFAQNEAERDTEAVAQPVRAGTRSIFENTLTSPLAKTGFAFASEARQKAALFAWSAYKVKSDPSQAAKVAFLTFIVGGLVSQVLKNLWREAKDDDDEKMWSAERLVKATIAGPLHGVPGVSELMGDPGLFSGFKWSSEAVKKIATKAMEDDLDEVTMRDVENALSAAGYFNDAAAGVAGLSHLGFDFAKILQSMTEEE